MKRSLPAHRDYYRPTHARELRQRARQLERWRVVLRPYLGVLAFLLVSAPAILLILFAIGKRDEWGLAVLALGAAFLPLLLEWPSRLARRAREQAYALEAEHQVRHGELDSGDTRE